MTSISYAFITTPRHPIACSPKILAPTLANLSSAKTCFTFACKARDSAYISPSCSPSSLPISFTSEESSTSFTFIHPSLIPEIIGGTSCFVTSSLTSFGMSTSEYNFFKRSNLLILARRMSGLASLTTGIFEVLSQLVEVILKYNLSLWQFCKHLSQRNTCYFCGFP